MHACMVIYQHAQNQQHDMRFSLQCSEDALVVWVGSNIFKGVYGGWQGIAYVLSIVYFGVVVSDMVSFCLEHMPKCITIHISTDCHAICPIPCSVLASLAGVGAHKASIRLAGTICLFEAASTLRILRDGHALPVTALSKAQFTFSTDFACAGDILYGSCTAKRILQEPEELVIQVRCC